MTVIWKVISFSLILAAFLLAVRLPPAKRKLDNLKRAALYARCEQIVPRKQGIFEKYIYRVKALVDAAKMSIEKLVLFVLAADCAGFAAGMLLFHDLVLSLTAALCCTPLPVIYMTVSVRKKQRIGVDRLASAMSVISNAYIGNDDIIKSVTDYAKAQNSGVSTPFDEFAAEVSYIDTNTERALRNLALKIDNRYFSEWIKILTLCHRDRRLKFALLPIVDSMNDAAGMQIESDTQIGVVWREYILTAALMFGVIPILKFANNEWYLILTTTFIGRILISLMLAVSVITSFYVMRINKPVYTA